jgi:hypothetical protein
MSESELEEALRAHEVPAPPPGLADRVASEVAAREKAPRRSARRALAVAGLVVAGAALVAGASALRSGETVAAGERAPGARQTIALGRRAILVAEGGSALHWHEGPQGRLTVEQSRGNVFYRVESGPFAVETPQGTVHVRGTCFRVEVRDMKLSRQALTGAAVGAAVTAAVLVTVYEGRVSVAREATEVEVAAGQAAALNAGAPTSVVEAAGTGTPPPPPAPALAPPGVGGAAELAALRARVAEQEKELAQLRPKVAKLPPDKDRNMIDPSREELLARAQRCEIAFHYPHLDTPRPSTVGEAEAKKVGLSDTEREAADEVLKELHAEVPGTLRKLFAEMSGDAATAERLSPSTLMSEILQKAPEDLVNQARTRISRERAGLASPPTNLSAVPVVERALRLMVGIGDEFERRLGERVGSARAHTLQKLRESWGSSSTMSGCAGQ